MSIARAIASGSTAATSVRATLREKFIALHWGGQHRSGMVMAVDSGRFDVVARIEYENLDAEVYDINVERTQ